MPTYEYRCGTCTHQFEVFASMSDPDPEVCEACGESTLEKVLFPVAIHYKGSGFYSTDYNGKRNAGTGDSKSSDSTSVAGTSTSEGSGSGSSSSDSGSAGGSSSGASSTD